MDELDEKMRARAVEMLRHATADNTYRNHWCCADGEDDAEQLVAAGLFARGATLNAGRDRYYHATDAGKALVDVALEAERDARGLRAWWVEHLHPEDRPGEDFKRWVDGETVWARSRGAARWQASLDAQDVGAEPMEALRRIRVTVAENVRAKSRAKFEREVKS